MASLSNDKAGWRAAKQSKQTRSFDEEMKFIRRIKGEPCTWTKTIEEILVSEVCPIASLYLPATQKSQTVAVPLANVPLGQVVASYSQLDEPARLNLSVAHGLHVFCPVWSW